MGEQGEWTLGVALSVTVQTMLLKFTDIEYIECVLNNKKEIINITRFFKLFIAFNSPVKCDANY